MYMLVLAKTSFIFQHFYLQKPLSRAERDVRRIEKLKTSNQYDEYKQKKAESMKRNRAEKRRIELKLSQEKQKNAIEQRRVAIRERVRKCRAKARAKNQQNTNENETSQNEILSEIVAESYSCTQTLGKAVKKVARAFPASPRKKRAILAHIVSNLNDEDKEKVVNVVSKPSFKRKVLSSQLISDIRKYYERDDISRTSPNSRDVKKYKCPDTDEELYLPTKHMVLSTKEAYALFVESRKRKELGMNN